MSVPSIWYDETKRRSFPGDSWSYPTQLHSFPVYDPDEVQLILDLDQQAGDLAVLKARLANEATPYTLDIETTGLYAFADDATVVTIQFTFDDFTTVNVVLDHPDAPRPDLADKVLLDLCHAILDGPGFVAQNTPFDCAYLSVITGLDMSPAAAWDTKLVQHTLTQLDRSRKLKDLAPALIAECDRWDDGIDFKRETAQEVSLSRLLDYAGADAHWTHCLFIMQQEALGLRDRESNGPGDDAVAEGLRLVISNLITPIMRMFCRQRARGLAFNPPHADEVEKVAVAEAERLALALRDLAPASLLADIDEAEAEKTRKWLNANSLVFKRLMQAWVDDEALRPSGTKTGTGNVSWKADELNMQAAEGFDVADTLLEFRAVDKLPKTLKKTREHAEGNGGRLTPSFGFADTGRATVGQPGLHSTPAKLKPMIVADPGRCLVEIDYSGIELRVLAALVNCPTPRQLFAEGGDLHAAMGAEIGGIPIEQVDSELRAKGKVGNFSLGYGMSARTFSTRLRVFTGQTVPLSESEVIRDAFYRLWDPLSDWHAAVTRSWEQYGFVRSPLGRLRRVWHHDAFWTKALNFPIQSTASDILQLAGAAVEGLLPWYPTPAELDDVHVAFTIHDALLVDMPADDYIDQRVESVIALMRDVPHLLEPFPDPTPGHKLFAPDWKTAVVFDAEAGEPTDHWSGH